MVVILQIIKVFSCCVCGLFNHLSNDMLISEANLHTRGYDQSIDVVLDFHMM